MRPLGYIVLLCLFLAPLRPVLGQESSISVEFVTTDELVSKAGGVLTLVYRISTTDPAPTLLTPELVLPQSWLLVSRLAPIEVSNSEPAVGFATIRVGQSSRSGLHEVSLRVSDPRQPARSGVGLIQVTVPHASGIKLSVQTANTYVRAGEFIQIPVRVTNSGNQWERIHIDVTGPPDADIRLDSSRVHLGPQQTRVVHLTVETSSRASVQTVYELYVHARSGGQGGAFQSLSTRVHVIPGFGQLDQVQATRPLNLSLQSVGDETGGGGQLGMNTRFNALGGDLDLQLLLASRDRVPMFGSRETYRLRYESDRVTLRLGDQTQTQSPLTTRGDFGAGLGLAVKTGKWTVSGFGQRSRYRFPQENLFGWSVGYVPGEASRFSLNGVRREGSYAGSALTARTELSPFGKNQHLDVECGLNAAQGLESPSCSADLRISTRDLSYQGGVSSSSQTHPGYQQGLLSKHARLSYRLPYGLNLEGSWRAQETNLLGSLRTLEHRQIGTSLNLQLRGVRSFSRVSYSEREWDYLASNISIDRFEGSLRFQQGLSTRRLNLNGTIDFGDSRSAARNYSGTGRRYQASARFVPSRTLSISVTGETASGYLNGATRPTDRRMLNLQGRARLGKATDLSLSVYQNVIKSATTQKYSTYRASVKHRFRGGHEVLMQAQVSAVPNSIPGYAADYQLSYLFPLNVPIGAVSDETILVGRIYDAESGAGIDGVLVLLGSAATLSDPDGRFEIMRPSGFKAFLSLDQRSIGYESVPLLSMPLEIDPTDVLPDVLEIPVARSSGLKGQVTVYGSSSGAVLLGDTNPQVALSGLGNVVLALSSSSNEYRTRTGATGRYEFRNVAPGDYDLRVVAHPRMDDYVFESESASVSLKGGGSIEDVNFKVVPDKPRIRMMTSTLQAPGNDAAVAERTQAVPRLVLPAVTEAGASGVKPSQPLARSEAVPTRAGVPTAWSSDAAYNYTILVPVSSSARAARTAAKFEAMGYQVRVSELSSSVTAAETARPFLGEGIFNLLKRHGYAGTEENLALFERLNSDLLSGGVELFRDQAYRLPDANRREAAIVVSIGQFRSYSGAAIAVREVAPASTWRAHIVPLAN